MDKTQKIINLIFGFVLLLFSFSCASPGTSEESSTSAASTTAPTVTSISPANDATSIALNSTIAITYSIGIPPSSVTVTTNESCSGTIMISSDGFNNCIPAAISSNTSRNVYTLTPGSSSTTSDLNTSAVHQVRVTTALKDYFGNAFADNYTSTGFTTVSVCASSCSWSAASAKGLTAGSGHGATVHLGKLWSIGGYDGSSTNQKVFSSADGITWTEATGSFEWSARYNHAVVSYDEKLWIIGGDNSSSLLNDVWNSSSGSIWTQVTSSAAWSARSNHTVHVFNGKLYLIGGVSAGNLNDVWSSTDGITWDNVTSSANWSARNEHASAVFNNKLWVMGGNNSNGDLADTWSSSDGKTWTQVTPTGSAWAARKGHSAQVFDGKLWVVGGNGGSGTLASWSSSDGTAWTSVGNLKSNVPSRSGIAIRVVGNKLIVMGGYDGVWRNDVFRYGP